MLSLFGLAGRPATGVVILETYAGLGCVEELPEFFHSWRSWSAAVLHSHAAYPVLAYFGSVDSESEWTSAMTSVMDAASLVIAFTDDASKGSAILLHRAGSRTAARIASLYGLSDDLPAPTPEQSDRLRARLRSAGFAMRAESGATSEFHRLRTDYAGRLAAIAAHMGADVTPLLPDREVTGVKVP